MLIRERITRILQEELTPIYLNVEDFSEKHVGHAGYRDGGQTHFSVVVVSSALEGKSRVDRHRMIYNLLDSLIAQGIHALKLTTLTPEEAAMRKTFA
ncbi:MAG: BolA family protein [Pseudobdellovibrionaceae bacterium]